jgi:nucleoside-triphosphatase THEP1
MKLRALDPLLYPVDDDVIHNESRFIEHFYELITQSIEPPYAVSIDGMWGSGKTTVMKMLQGKLETAGFPVFWFNPWEYRQTESVVLAFLQCLANENKDLLKEMKKSGSKMLRVLLEAGMDVGLKLITQNNLALKDVKKSFDSTEKEQLPSYDQYENTIETIKNEFRELVNRISKKHDNKPVIIFFDDLDRCLPDDSIQLLEAMKNLFVVKECNAIFICGIDTHIAKQFISAHYHGIEEMFAINYFRKIFNLTISMPIKPNIYKFLLRYMKEQYGEDDPIHQNAGNVAKMIGNSSVDAQIFSLRKYLNIINNFNLFLKFNPDYNNKIGKEHDFIVYLLLLKEAWQPVYEELIKSALMTPTARMEGLISSVVARSKEKKILASNVGIFLNKYFGKTTGFDKEYPSKWIQKYHTLI